MPLPPGVCCAGLELPACEVKQIELVQGYTGSVTTTNAIESAKTQLWTLGHHHLKTACSDICTYVCYAMDGS